MSKFIGKSPISLLLVFLAGVATPYSFLFIEIGRSWSLGTFAMIVYIISMVPRLNLMFSLKQYYGKFIWLPTYFFILLILTNILHYDFENKVPIFNSTLFLNLLFMYCLLIHNLIDNRAIKLCLLGYVLGLAVEPILFLCGIGVGFEAQSGRMTVFEQESNTVGVQLCCTTAVILCDYIFEDKLHLKIFRFLFFALIIPTVLFIIATASRTAFIGLVLVIILSCIIGIRGGYLTKLFFSILIIIGIGNYVISELDASSILVQRLTKTVEDNDVSERDELFENMAPEFFSAPIIGHGETGYVEVSRKTVGLKVLEDGTEVPRSPHNVLLEIALYTGGVGLLIMVSFWYSLMIRSIRLIKKKHEATPIIILLPIFFAIISQQLLILTWVYIVYAYIISSTRQTNKLNLK